MNTRLEIAGLHQALGASMIYVTHDQTEAMTLADKIVVLRDGRVEQSGSPMQLYNDPVNQFVAGFLGSPAMNFIPAEYLQAGDSRTLGVRPEDIRVDSAGKLSATVLHVEQLGGDTHVVARAKDRNLTARLFGQHAIEQGQSVNLEFPSERLFYFDKHGARLL